MSGSAHRRHPRRRADRGAGLVEYAFLVALIAVVCIVSVVYFGNETSSKFTDSGTSIANS